MFAMYAGIYMTRQQVILTTESPQVQHSKTFRLTGVVLYAE